MMRMKFVVVALAAATLVSGCSPSPPDIVPVEGIVTLDGKPLPEVEVRFLPLIQGFGGEYAAVAITDAEGKFVMQVMGQPGACAAPTMVTIDEAPLPDEARGMSGKAQMLASKLLSARKNRPIPPQYTTYAKSPLKLEITAERTTYNLELTR